MTNGLLAMMSDNEDVEYAETGNFSSDEDRYLPLERGEDPNGGDDEDSSTQVRAGSDDVMARLDDGLDPVHHRSNARNDKAEIETSAVRGGGNLEDSHSPDVKSRNRPAQKSPAEPNHRTQRWVFAIGLGALAMTPSAV
ncbi:hypothetical protein CYLTODRAFT_462217 [Cylindrobasidium torrendii FP15055 ss-10]|uniref:Uncharacterized protein n=1 Tax=Cylindrobasidium torrendii FP15055 ss-10 TaxID=1314674 RepID=A0A0D7BBS9_9AGAR|nr:hypothetical protein CYLTODRAFT_462217 [Cylindrobasidium torrendii FP15055 ss-10]